MFRIVGSSIERRVLRCIRFRTDGSKHVGGSRVGLAVPPPSPLCVGVPFSFILIAF